MSSELVRSLSSDSLDNLSADFEMDGEIYPAVNRVAAGMRALAVRRPAVENNANDVAAEVVRLEQPARVEEGLARNRQNPLGLGQENPREDGRGNEFAIHVDENVRGNPPLPGVLPARVHQDPRHQRAGRAMRHQHHWPDRQTSVIDFLYKLANHGSNHSGYNLGGRGARRWGRGRGADRVRGRDAGRDSGRGADEAGARGVRRGRGGAN